MIEAPKQGFGWRTPETLLILLAIAMPLSFSTWMALINNFALENAGFDGIKIGILQSWREIPGFLSFTVIFVLLLIREQRLMLIALIVLGIGTLITGYMPTFWGLMITTMIMSTGFHYYEALHQSLCLQWLPKDQAPQILGRIVSARSFAALVSFGLIYLAVDMAQLPLKWVYTIGGCATIAIGIFCWVSFPEMRAKSEQSKKIVLRKKYWLWYGLVFLSGSRRQIFMVFSGFLMVEKFGFSVANMSLMFLANQVATVYLAPKIGKFIGRVGERRALIIEYVGLIFVFTAYAFASVAWFAVILYILDHVLFALAIAIKTYFQKIAKPEDIASSSGVSFTISHIVAVVIPAAFGFVWVISPSYVFLAAAGIAMLSLVLALMVPRHPTIDNVATINYPKAVPAGAE
ncbi:MAG: MFS transporter [Rhodospirillaceae bacterium]|nr:MFS transporter [Rhodospirillaceae bacterium]MBT3908339.1 MFS transporter [Rhodospirillaceae bacterium]MBT5296950.1 MFS transporter [Rhodospirillaceae bacterium]MBT6087867.1 MFS transporter [Rhodospirillaceae bacterium]MBT6608947.1 MFS transporter [Rhodospirillaceae bacterium]